MKKNFTIYGLIQTEKAQSVLGNKIYVIRASRTARKPDIEDFLDKNFKNAKVSSIRSCNYKSSSRVFRGHVGKTKSFKKFYITLSDGEIDVNVLKDSISNVE